MPEPVGLLPSILDRLDDPDSGGTVARSGYSVEQMARAVQRDLEHLLNTRSNDSETLATFPRLARILGYGLPDLAEMTRLAGEGSGKICRTLEEKILRYEPRLKEVHVSLNEAEAGNPLKIQLHLRAVLAVDPAPELILDTTLDLGSGHFSRVV